ncbi:MAG TPA: molybdopterin cofactor-binding domain-containing protein [Candidatus Angelobacter sp.]|nr:molybdopterin cofactor-binding domain-containing protein [Candidatus Angelobacter sp.]
MTAQVVPELNVEPERYELRAAPVYHFDLARRDFFKVFGSGIVVLLLLEEVTAQESGGGRRRGGGQRRPQELGAWLHIGKDGVVTVFTGKAEVGQNIRTSLSQVVAEELRVPVVSIRLTMGDTELTPFDAGTFGSRTTPDMAAQLRKISAAAREALVGLASEQLKIERSQLVVESGRVTHPGSNRSVAFGELAGDQKLLKTVADNPATTPAVDWKIAGTSVPKVSGRDFVTGGHKYTPDIKRPGMLHGKVLRPPAFGSTLTSADTGTAEAMPGVVVVRDGDFVGVAAPDEQIAERAVAAIRTEWKTSPQTSDKELFDELKKTSSTSGGRGGGGNQTGSMEEGLAAADHKLRQTYTIAYIAHAPLEPRAAVAEWKDDKLTVWTGTQRPFGVRGDLAQAFRVPEERVRVIVPDTGSGYGGKHTGEAAVEAARLAKAAGKPVKLVWTREEEFTWAYFRPAGVIEASGGVRADGTITAWEFHNYNSGGSAIRPLYDIPNQKVEFHSARSPLRQGSYRALAATANHFARESYVDELAHAVKMDPLEFRLKNLKDARLRAVLEAAASTFGWGKTKLPSGHGAGIAVGSEKGSCLATCAEVGVDPAGGKIRIVRVVQAFECGAILNPDHLKNQNEGAIVMGLGGALFEAIRFENGKILNPQFSRYRVPRFADAPRIEIVLLDRKDSPSTGAGETPIVGIAPAVGNAIFDATGVRLRSLPMLPNGLKV